MQLRERQSVGSERESKRLLSTSRNFLANHATLECQIYCARVFVIIAWNIPLHSEGIFIELGIFVRIQKRGIFTNGGKFLLLPLRKGVKVDIKICR